MEFKKVNVGRIKEKLEKSGINRPYYIAPDIPLYRVKEGDNYIRILPPVGDVDDFGLDIWVHSFLGPDRGSYLCVEKTNVEGIKRKKCVLCDLYRRMQGKNEEMARALAPRRRTLYWVLDVSEKPQSEEPLLFDAPYRQVAEEILMRCVDRRTGEVIDISDVEDGREIIFRMSKQSRKYPEYRAVELGSRYKISPKLAKKIVPLTEVLVIPDEAELIELVDILYEYGNSGGYEERREESRGSREEERSERRWGGREERREESRGSRFKDDDEDGEEELPRFSRRFMDDEDEE